VLCRRGPLRLAEVLQARTVQEIKQANDRKERGLLERQQRDPRRGP
jgi:hypothetical protein